MIILKFDTCWESIEDMYEYFHKQFLNAITNKGQISYHDMMCILTQGEYSYIYTVAFRNEKFKIYFQDKTYITADMEGWFREDADKIKFTKRLYEGTVELPDPHLIHPYDILERIKNSGKDTIELTIPEIESIVGKKVRIIKEKNNED